MAGEIREPRWSWFFPIGYFLRQGLLAWAAVIVIGAEVAAMAQRGAQWRGDLVWTIDWLPVSFVLVGPVLAGCAAVETSRTADGAGHLFRNRVPRTPAFAVAVAYAAVLGAAHLLVLLGALAISAPPVGDRWAFLAVVCQLLILAFFAALGSLAGRFAGPVIAGAGGALAAFALVFIASSPNGRVVLLEIGGATIPRVGYAYNERYLLAQAAALVLAITGLMALRPLDGAQRRRIALRDVVVSLVMLAGVIAVSLGPPAERLKPVYAQPTYCGAVRNIPTCFYPQHKRLFVVPRDPVC